MSELGQKREGSERANEVRFTPIADIRQDRMSALCRFCCRSPLRIAANSDSVALKRSAAEAGDDGAAEARTEATVLFIQP